jgi:hypothetical protein
MIVLSFSTEKFQAAGFTRETSNPWICYRESVSCEPSKLILSDIAAGSITRSSYFGDTPNGLNVRTTDVV